MSGKTGADDFIVAQLAAHNSASKARKALEACHEREVLGEGEYKPLIHQVLTLPEFYERDFPPRDYLIDRIISTASLTMVFGATGIGKSWFVMLLMLALANGSSNLPWTISRACRCLLLDGEMPPQQLLSRLRSLSKTALDNIDILLSDLLYRDGEQLNIGEPEHQQRILLLLDDLAAQGRNPDIIFIDNLSSMMSGVDENSNSDQDSFLRFILTLRHRNYAVVLVHHAGKNNEQRGASRRMDLLDTVIKLTEPKDSGPSANMRFQVEFTKARGLRPNPDRVTIELEQRGNGLAPKWQATGQRKTERWEQVLRTIREHTPRRQNELAKFLGMSASTLSGHLKRLRQDGYLTAKGMALTDLGTSYLKTMDEIPERKF